MGRKPDNEGMLAIDLGGSQVSVCRLAESDTAETGYELADYVQCDLASVPSEHREAARTSAVFDFLSFGDKKNSSLAVSIPGRSVFSRVRCLPPIPESKILQIIRYEIQQQVPFDLRDLNIDYQILGCNPGGTYTVLMAAVKKDVVESHLVALQKNRSSVEILTPSPLAAFNWLIHNGQIGALSAGDKPVAEALVNIGAETTDVICFIDGQFAFTRPISIGGDQLTAAAAKDLDCSWAEAEELKYECGNAEDSILKPISQRLATELNRSFAYFRALPGNGKVRYVHLTGGTSYLAGLKDYLTDELTDVEEVFLPDPLAGLGLDGFGSVLLNSQQMPTVLGLALACQQDVAVDINLI